MIESQSSVSGTELKTLIDRMMEAFGWDAGIEFYPLEMPQYRTARLALEQYVGKLQEALVMFREEQARDKETIAALRRGEDVNT